MDMRKSRFVSVFNHEVSNINSIDFSNNTANSSVHDQCRRSTNLPNDELALGRPMWADFDMETAFWHALGDICLREGLSGPEFVDIAKTNYLGIPTDSAVRLHIITTIQKKSDFPSFADENSANSLHESI